MLICLQSTAMGHKRQEIRPLGQNLRLERVRLGFNQTELGRVGGVSKTTQIAYEAGASQPTASYLSRVFEVGVDVNWLLTGRHASPAVQWELLFEVLALVEDWAAKSAKPIKRYERNDFVRTLYAQFCAENRIDRDQLQVNFRLLRDRSVAR